MAALLGAISRHPTPNFGFDIASHQLSLPFVALASAKGTREKGANARA